MTIAKLRQKRLGFGAAGATGTAAVLTAISSEMGKLLRLHTLSGNE